MIAVSFPEEVIEETSQEVEEEAVEEDEATTLGLINTKKE